MVKVEPLDLDGPASGGRCRHRRRSSLRRSVSEEGLRAYVTSVTALQASPPGQAIFRVRHYVRDVFLKSGWLDSAVAHNTRKFLRGKWFMGVTVFSLFAALFLGEIFALAQVPSNTALDVLLSLVFVVFALEFLGCCATDTSYILGFFFWMDLLGTVSMIFDISFMAGIDVTEPFYVNRDSGSSQSNVIVVRATRATKLGARAGRISRVLKILRFLPFLMKSEDDKRVKMAKVISNQLTHGLSTRVAFLTIAIVVIMPLFTMFAYPEEDDSMGAWTQLLAVDATAFHEAWTSGNTTLTAIMKDRLVSEAARFKEFYKHISYGPFAVEFGESSDSGAFTPLPDELDLGLLVGWTFSGPGRKSSMRVVTQGRIQTFFDMTTPKVQEAGCNIGLICFIILIMCCFGLLMSSSISVVALQPLERMLAVVRERCTQIFKYTDNLKDDSDSESDTTSEYDDMEHDSEFVLLEKVVAKLAAIADLSSSHHEVEIKAYMTEHEIMQVSWMQGAQLSSRVSSEQKRGKAEGVGSMDREPRSAANSLPISIVDALQTPNFNTLDLSKEHKISTAVYLMVDVAGAASAWARNNIPEAHIWAFTRKVESEYHANPFHNFAHAIDVEYGVYRYMCLIDAERFLSQTMQFSLLVAAIGHDIGHTGVNNPFLVETSHELAVRYNDRSPLENMHCARLFQVMTALDTNLFVNIERDLYKELRKGIIHAILHTDVTKHNEMIKDLGMLYQMNSQSFDDLKPENAIKSSSEIGLISGMLLHGADVSNPIKPWEVCARLARLCMDEFFAQGDMEKKAGIPVQMLNDRDKVNTPNAQIGFIEFFIAPMVTEMVHLFPPLHCLAEFLGQNIQNWSDIWQQEAAPAPDVVAKVTARVQKLSEKMQVLAQQAEQHERLKQG